MSKILCQIHYWLPENRYAYRVGIEEFKILSESADVYYITGKGYSIKKENIFPNKKLLYNDRGWCKKEDLDVYLQHIKDMLKDEYLVQLESLNMKLRALERPIKIINN